MHGTVKFQRHANRRGEEWTTKRISSVRENPISSELLQELRSLDKKSEYVFPGKDSSKPINNFRKALKTAIAKSGVERNGEPIHGTPQIIRKAVTTWLIEAGIPESMVQALVGHARGSRVTQKVYIRHSKIALKSVVIPLSSEVQIENENTTTLATNGNKTKDNY